MLKRDSLPEQTRLVFDLASSCRELENFTLMGGTAMALHLGHRQSLDLDFAVFSRALPTLDIDKWVSTLRGAGIKAHPMVDHHHASAFRINRGEDLTDFIRDYEVGGVKVQFFCINRGRELNEFYSKESIKHKGEATFKILSIDGLKVAKTLLLSDRARSRDLYDLMTLFKDNGLTLEEMSQIADKYDTRNDFRRYTNVLSGAIPLDPKDEGLLPTNVSVEIEDMYTFFGNKIDSREGRLALERFQGRDTGDSNGGIKF